MCLILFAYKSHPDYILILAGNRDEFYDRPSEPAAFWDEYPGMLAGKDLKGGGTWFGVTRTGKFAGITNYRDPKSHKKNAPSRGLLVTRFLTGKAGPRKYLEDLKKEADRYNGFNLILGWKDELFWYSNRGKGIKKLSPGIYGLSNHLLDTPWPKLVKGKSAFEGLVAGAVIPGPDEFFRLLEDRIQADDSELPETGVGLERERMLSPVFISSSNYGTCSSTLLFIDRDERVTFIERTFKRYPNTAFSSTYDFRIESAVSG